MIIDSAPVSGADTVHTVGAADAVTGISESDPLSVVWVWKYEGASCGGKQELKLRCAQQRSDLGARSLFHQPARKRISGRERLTKCARKRAACGDHARDKQGPAEWAGTHAVSGEHYLKSHVSDTSIGLYKKKGWPDRLTGPAPACSLFTTNFKLARLSASIAARGPAGPDRSSRSPRAATTPAQAQQPQAPRQTGSARE